MTLSRETRCGLFYQFQAPPGPGNTGSQQTSYLPSSSERWARRPLQDRHRHLCLRPSIQAGQEAGQSRREADWSAVLPGRSKLGRMPDCRWTTHRWREYQCTTRRRVGTDFRQKRTRYSTRWHAERRPFRRATQTRFGRSCWSKTLTETAATLRRSYAPKTTAAAATVLRHPHQYQHETKMSWEIQWVERY